MQNTLDLVDPELRSLLEAWPTTALTTEGLAELRDMRRRPPPPPIPPNDVTRTGRSIPGPAGAPDVALVIYTPAGLGPFPCIYHIHGGGYIAGTASVMEFMHRPLAAELGCVIVSVDYRLAPETVFPGAIDDCYAGLAWTFANAKALNVDVSQVGVMGESAGGGLAASLALLARDRGSFALAFQCLTYPMIDDRTCAVADPHPLTGEFIWTPHNNRFGWSALLGDEPGGSDVSPYAAAARASDLSRLPPTYIATGTLDLFLEEDIDYARRLLRAGVATELHVYPGAFHGFDVHPTAAVAIAARAGRIAALRRFLTKT